jgi:murein DD-endopeptidase MepM/ murein hydrolase activator NlpD
VLTHPGGIATVYSHAHALAVSTGQTVTAGQVIGWVGSGRNSGGPHLHVELHRLAITLNSSTAIDPVAASAGVTG